jgi:hypothetical protein
MHTLRSDVPLDSVSNAVGYILSLIGEAVEGYISHDPEAISTASASLINEFFAFDYR